MHLLAELVESFRRQTYQGPMRLLILNDRHDQFLTCSVPNVDVYNATLRYQTLGLKRQALLAKADAELVQWWDDDDIFLPDHVARSVAKLGSGNATRMTFEVRSHRSGAVSRQFGSGFVGYTTRLSVMREIGIEPIDRGEWDRIVRVMVGRAYLLADSVCQPDGPPTYLLRQEHDCARAYTASHAQIATDCDYRQHDGREPRGAIDIIPSWSQDWTAAVRNLDKGSVPDRAGL
jgi:hypothetical protein